MCQSRNTSVNQRGQREAHVSTSAFTLQTTAHCLLHLSYWHTLLYLFQVIKSFFVRFLCLNIKQQRREHTFCFSRRVLYILTSLQKSRMYWHLGCVIVNVVEWRNISVWILPLWIVLLPKFCPDYFCKPHAKNERKLVMLCKRRQICAFCSFRRCVLEIIWMPVL